MSGVTAASLLAIKPSQRTADDVEQLVSFLADLPFFSGANDDSLQVLSGCLGLQVAAPGEALLHVGELTDRLYLLLRGRCSLVRHSRKEGFSPRPAELLEPGQALCEASLVVSGRRSDVAVTVLAAQPAEALGGSTEGASSDGADVPAGGGAEFAVLTRAAWSNICTRATTQPEYAEARMAVLCCAARSLAGSDPGSRTPEQADDLAALLRMMPALSSSPAAMLRYVSESAALRCLPPGCVLFEEATRAEAQFVVLSGEVQMHVRPKRQGAGANRAALRSALKSAVAAARTRSALRSRGGSRGGAPEKTVRQRIEEERRARVAIKESLALQREGLRSARPRTGKATVAQKVELEFKRWMLEFLDKKRGQLNPDPIIAQPLSMSAPASPARARPAAAQSAATAAATTVATLLPAAASKAATAWRRAAFKVLNTQPEGEPHDAHAAAVAIGDMTLLEYERRKQEEAGGLRDVGNMLGGAAARKAYIRGIQRGASGLYECEDLPPDTGAGADVGGHAKGGGVHWVEGGDVAVLGDGSHDQESIEDIDEEDADPWIRLAYLDRSYQVKRKALRYVDAMERVMGVAKDSSSTAAGSAKSVALQSGRSGASAAPSGAAGGGGELDEPRTSDEVHLLLLADGGNSTVDGEADPFGDAASDLYSAADGPPRHTGAGSGSPTGEPPAAAAGAAAPQLGPGEDEEIEDACEEHLDQLYGRTTGVVEVGQVAGEVPPAALDRAARQAPRPKRDYSAIAGPCGSDVLVVPLSALRRGADSAREEVLSERGSALSALDPVRGLKGDAAAALALEAEVVCVDANQVIVRQGQLVEAMFVVLDGEVRLLDDPDSSAAAGPQPQPPPGPPPGGGAAATANGGGASDSPFRGLGTGGVLASIRARRTAASLSALTLLGPGGSFGESVLGYPGDEVAGEAEQHAHARNPGETGDHDVGPTTTYLATAVASRASKLLVLSRSLLLRYPALHSLLPPFAALRRDALATRRQQLQQSVQNRPAALSVATQQPHPPPQGHAASTGASGAAQHHAQVTPLLLPALTSPTAAVGSGGVYQTPRPPPARPSEVLEQMGFKPVMRRVYNAVGKAVAGGGSSSASSGAGGASGSHNAVAGQSASGASAGGTVGPDRQRRQDLLAASSLAHNAPHSLSSAVARARGEELGPNGLIPHSGSPTLPQMVRQASQGSLPPTWGSMDALPIGVGAVASLALRPNSPLQPTAGSGSFSGPLPRMRASASGALTGGGPPLLGILGSGSLTQLPSGLWPDGGVNSPPVRRSSLSGIMTPTGAALGGGLGLGGVVAAGAGGAAANAAAASPQRGPRMGGGQWPTLVLPRLSAAVPGGAASSPVGGGGRAHQRGGGNNGESLLVRLDAHDGSAQNYAAHHSGVRNGRLGSGGPAAAGPSGSGGSMSGPLPLAISLRTVAGQPALRA